MGKNSAKSDKATKLTISQPADWVAAWREQAKRLGVTISTFLGDAALDAMDDDLAIGLSDRRVAGRPDNGRRMAVRNDLSGEIIYVDARKPLTASRLRRWRTALGATPECDALGGHGEQDDPVRYERLLRQAERVDDVD